MEINVDKSLIKYLNDRELGRNLRARFNFSNFSSKNICQKDVREHTGCVNALELNRSEELLLSGGDDLVVKLWRVDDMIRQRKPKPIIDLKATHFANVFSVEFSLNSNVAYSGDRVGLLLKHDVETGTKLAHRKFSDEVLRINQCPTDDNLIAVTCSNKIRLLDERLKECDVICNKQYSEERFYNGEFNPSTSRFFLASSFIRGPIVYDIRNATTPVIDSSMFESTEAAGLKIVRTMASSWNPSGNGFATIFAKNSPVFFNLTTMSILKMDDPMYVNKQTIKSLCFINDETIATGSDTSAICIWNLKKALDYTQNEAFDETKQTKDTIDDETNLTRATSILLGHRSTPNQLRYCSQSEVLFTSGVEKIVKIWSNHKLPWSYDLPYVRKWGVMFENNEAEDNREKHERLTYEKEMGDEMQGRSCYEDVFGGDKETAEDRDTCRMFDPYRGEISKKELESYIAVGRVQLHPHEDMKEWNNDWTRKRVRVDRSDTRVFLRVFNPNNMDETMSSDSESSSEETNQIPDDPMSTSGSSMEEDSDSDSSDDATSSNQDSSSIDDSENDDLQEDLEDRIDDSSDLDANEVNRAQNDSDDDSIN